METVEKKAKMFDRKWNLINDLADLCDDYIDNDMIYTEDAFVALERVKWHLMSQHATAKAITICEGELDEI